MKKLIFLLMFIPGFAFAGGPEGIQHPPLQINDNGNISYGYFYLLTITGGTLTNNGDGTLTEVCGAVSTNFLLLEDGSFFLLEDGSKLILG